jgi:hypothetical protein
VASSAEVFNARGVLGGARGLHGVASRPTGVDLDASWPPDCMRPSGSDARTAAAQASQERTAEPNAGRDMRPSEPSPATRQAGPRAPGLAKEGAAHAASISPSPPIAARAAAARIADQDPEAQDVQSSRNPQDMPEAQASSLPAHLLLSPGEGGLDVAARVGRLDREARARLRDEIGALLARHGLRLASLRRNGETNLRAPAGKEID